MKKQLFAVGALALFAGVANAQELKDGYVTFPNPQKLTDYVNQWNGGSGTITVNGSAWEDEEFFTSRVKPRTRVTATAVNIHDLGNMSGRRLLYWVPLGDPGTQGLPNAKFDSEAFSLWSYVDHYGSFTSPFGWVAGAMADAAHKNGVAVSGIASVPQSIPSEWTSALSSLGSTFGSDSKAETLGKFLLYHGTDGLAYNSEWSGLSPSSSGLIAMHNGLYKYMADKNPVYENIWYDGTTDSGGCNFDSALSGKTGLYKGSSMFSNYNWNSSSLLSTGVSNANSVTGVDGKTRGPWWNYAGCNMQGGEPKSYVNAYNNLNNNQWSVGYWGAHSVNMIWANRNAAGSSTMAQQLYYTTANEQFFGNGKRNPAINMPIVDNASHRPNSTFHGASKYISERSAINMNIANEPFYTFFNLGNGTFFNWKGERVSNKEWYSLGIQDYMPTWRWWFADTWLNKNVTEGSTHLTAGITYDDAYVGGSCLKIEGSTTKEYLHLFKTAIIARTNQVLTVRYKLLAGEGDVNLVMGSVNNPSGQMKSFLTLSTVANSESIQDQSYDNGWVTQTLSLKGSDVSSSNMSGGIGVIGLEFANAKDLELLIGEISIMTAANTTTPAAPVIRSCKVLSNNYKGVDAKLIWTMDNDVARKAGTPKYNSDVNASMYRLYAQEEGGEAYFAGATTSWGAIIFQAPSTDDSKRIRFGVSAVSADTRTESAITWTEEFSKPSYTASNDIQINKHMIKANEGFVISYVDSRHSASNWKLVDASGNTVASANNTTVFSVPNGLSALGGYNLFIDAGTSNEREFGYYVQVSDDKVGALPDITQLYINDNKVSEGGTGVEVKLNENPVLAYDGRAADGSASRAISLNNHMIGASMADLGLTESKQSFTIAGWFKFNEIPDNNEGWNFINVSDLVTGGWPQSNWGWCWNHGDKDGNVFLVFRGAQSDSSSPGELHYSFPDLKLQANMWTHMAMVHEYSGNSFRCRLYVNGVLQKSLVYQYAVGNQPDKGAKSNNGTSLSWRCTTCGTTNCTTHGTREGINEGQDLWITNHTYQVPAAARAYFGGPKYQGAAIDGIVDDFQVWNKAMTQDEVKQSMNGFSGTLPSGIVALWDFESEPVNDAFLAKGSKANAKLYTYLVASEGEGKGQYEYYAPTPVSGCPFLTGTAYPVVTTASWKDACDRKTKFEKLGARAATEGESGSAKVTFNKVGDHDLMVTLENSYGSATAHYPIYEVKPAPTAIEGIEADGGLNTYTIDRTFFLEFAEGGNYKVEVYNAAGMLVAEKQLSPVAGQTAQVDMANAGVYLVRVSKDGTLLRTLKVAVR